MSFLDALKKGISWVLLFGIVVSLVYILIFMINTESLEKNIEFEIQVGDEEQEQQDTVKESKPPQKPMCSMTIAFITIAIVLSLGIIGIIIFNKRFRDWVSKIFQYLIKGVRWVLSILYDYPTPILIIIGILVLCVVILSVILLTVHAIKSKCTIFMSLVGDNPRVLGWCIASIVCAMIALVFLVVHVMGFFDKNTDGHQIILMFMVALFCLTIACISATLEGMAYDSLHKEKKVLYENFYYGEGKDTSFFIHSCAFMFAVMIFFTIIYIVFLHENMKIVCNSLYDKEDWTLYITGTNVDISQVFEDINIS